MFGARQKKHELSLKSGKLVLKYHTGPVNMGNYKHSNQWYFPMQEVNLTLKYNNINIYRLLHWMHDKNIPKQNSYKELLSMSEMVMKFQRATKSPQYI